MSLEALQDRALELPYVGVLVRAYLESRNHFNKDMSASVAYFSFLSIFPLVLGIISVGSLFLDSSEVRLRLDNFIAEAVPGGATLIIENIDTLIRLRGPIGLISVGVLLWSASKMVGAMTRGVNFALGQKRNYAFFLSPLRNFGLTLTVSILLLAAMSVSPVAEILSDVDLGWPSETIRDYLDVIAGNVVSFGITFAVFWSVYLLIPYKRPTWSALLPGTLVAALLFDAGRGGFLLYVGNASRFDAVYGSLTSIMVLLLWLYFSARFLLYGSEVIAVCENAKLERPDPR